MHDRAWTEILGCVICLISDELGAHNPNGSRKVGDCRALNCHVLGKDRVRYLQPSIDSFIRNGTFRVLRAVTIEYDVLNCDFTTHVSNTWRRILSCVLAYGTSGYCYSPDRSIENGFPSRDIVSNSVKVSVNAGILDRSIAYVMNPNPHWTVQSSNLDERRIGGNRRTTQ